MTEADADAGVLLDTCAAIWFVNGDAFSAEGAAAIIAAGKGPGIHISPVSAWEIGMLANPRRPTARALRFLPDPQSWFDRLMRSAGVRRADLTPDIAIDASFLPGDLHHDPADRLLIATSRRRGLPIVTRDRLILDYAAAGHVQAIAC